MTTAFVTGARGFLGLNLVEQLVLAGWEVTAFDRGVQNQRHVEQFPADHRRGDLTDIASLEAAVPQNVDAVFHVAGNTSIWSRNNAAQTRDNVEGTRNMLLVAQRKGANRFVHTSTWNTFGLEHHEISEDTPQTGGQSWVNYTRTKYLGELEVRRAVEQGLDAVILNPSHIVGRYDTRNWARMFRLVRHRRLPGIPAVAGVFAHAEAVAKAHVAAATQGRTGENYILGGTRATFTKVIGIIGELTGAPVPKRTTPGFMLKIAGHLQAFRAALTGKEPDLTPEGVYMLLNQPHVVSQKAANELGFQPVPIRVMLKDAYSWLEREGLLD